jgi:hypothetical protein
MAVTALLLIVWGYRRPVGERAFHHLAASVRGICLATRDWDEGAHHECLCRSASLLLLPSECDLLNATTNERALYPDLLFSILSFSMGSNLGSTPIAVEYIRAGSLGQDLVRPSSPRRVVVANFPALSYRSTPVS